MNVPSTTNTSTYETVKSSPSKLLASAWEKKKENIIFVCGVTGTKFEMQFFLILTLQARLDKSCV
jgi:hypothetical protein